MERIDILNIDILCQLVDAARRPSMLQLELPCDELSEMVEAFSALAPELLLKDRLIIGILTSGMSMGQIVAYANVPADDIYNMVKHCMEWGDLEDDTPLRMICNVLPVDFDFVTCGKVKEPYEAFIVSGGILKLMGDPLHPVQYAIVADV